PVFWHSVRLRRVLLRSVLPPATSAPDISTLSLHDALPISRAAEHAFLTGPQRIDVSRAPQIGRLGLRIGQRADGRRAVVDRDARDRKSTRLNSSHVSLSYAVFCLKKQSRHTTIIKNRSNAC